MSPKIYDIFSIGLFELKLYILIELSLKTVVLKKLKLINKNSQKLKILGTGDIKDKINIEADLISKSAVVKLEKAGGTIQLKK